ncbi:histidine kinase [Solwaraspora sp. WMMD1047]|uniref:sensor histidine kinase n=1 Tax=Solwaraspora sp. WMMD1047 TaxID=3016102 RepID=UPI002415E228|nr:histidine kinase [Solwaraspora sp. WMMD1047]MDG4831553.1 histidine kinase [Solwaraspora sp. WMMD1047]
MVLATLRRAGSWRLTYEILLTVLVTAGSTIPAVTAGVHPAAPWLVGVSTPILLVGRLVNPLAAYLAAAIVGLWTGGENSLLLAVLSVSFSYRAARWWQLAVGLAAAWACFLGAAWWWEERPDASTAVVLSAAFVLFAVFPAAAGRLVRRRRTLLAAMHRRNVLLHRQQDDIARQAQARERTRIARDLHDSLGHKLTLISLYAGMSRDGNAPLLRETSAAAMAELRQILGILGQDDTQSPVPSLTSLDELAQSARAAGSRVTIVGAGDDRPLAPLTEHAAYRVIQEGVTNALRHAHGGDIVLSLRYELDALVASVTNTAGRRVVRQTSGQGLLGLAERVRVAGGTLYHGATPDGGFRLAAILPYPESPADPATLADPAESALVAAAAGPAPPPAARADFAELVDRDRRRSRLTLAATTLAICGVLAICGAGLWLTTAFVTVDRATFDQARVGQDADEVRALLPDDGGISGAVGGVVAPDASCVDYRASLAEQLAVETGQDLIFRFCFRDGVLVDKQEFLDEGS